MDQKWLPQVKFLGSYTVPKIDVQFGASYQSIPGIEYAATYAAPNTVVQQSLGRLPTNGVATGTTTVNLLQPGRHLRPALQSDRPAPWQDHPSCEDAVECQPRHLQHHQFGGGQRGKRVLRHLARADGRRRAETAEGLVDVRLLNR